MKLTSKYKLFLLVSISLLSCQQNKSREKEIPAKENDVQASHNERRIAEGMPVNFDANLTLNWNRATNKIEEDSLYSTVKKDKKKLKILIENISNTENLNTSVCSKNEPLKKGDIAFIYLRNLDYIQNFRCLKKQFDVFEQECPYPYGLLDYLENNRAEVAEKVKRCVGF